MATFAALVFNPASLMVWLVVGVIAGWLAGMLMEVPSYGPIGELFMGAAGGLVGGFSLGFFVAGAPALWVSALVALVGACIFIGGGRAVTAEREA